MNSDLQQNLLELELDILALEMELRLKLVRSLPVAEMRSPTMARSQLWIVEYLPSVFPDFLALLHDRELSQAQRLSIPSVRA